MTQGNYEVTFQDIYFGSKIFSMSFVINSEKNDNLKQLNLISYEAYYLL